MLTRYLLPAAGLLIAMTVISSCHNDDHNAATAATITKTIDGYTFRDLNKNGKLDIYEDARQPVEARVNDLLGQMSLDEKAGMLFINGAKVNDDGSITDQPGKGMFAFVPNALGLIREKK